ncbi:MAG: type II toxin-antitoxin system YafQ family toxin [Cardiobacteriaceae bacterium]|nr:type II toxin-antitoxin system YafQ family toxin [Cardiobacteriaceae bacterium]
MAKLKIVTSAQFRRDVKRQISALLTSEWTEIIYCLINGLQLEQKYHDHQLTGNLKNFRECHIKPDLLLIYRIDGNDLLLYRIGSHSEVF